MESRGIRTIINSSSMIHTSDSIKERDITIIKMKRGKNYMKDFKRPAYYKTVIEQKDIHGYREEHNDWN